MPSLPPIQSVHRTMTSRATRHFKRLSLLALLIAGPCSAALVHYELTLTTKAPYTAFGGGAAGDIFTGTFGYDDTLLGQLIPTPYGMLLSEGSIFLDLGIHGTLFSTSTPGASHNNGLLFPGTPIDGDALLDIVFEITNPNGDRLDIKTDPEGDPPFWEAKEGSSSPSMGSDLPLSVQFSRIYVPEPSAWVLSAFGALSLLFHRRRTLH